MVSTSRGRGHIRGNPKTTLSHLTQSKTLTLRGVDGKAVRVDCEKFLDALPTAAALAPFGSTLHFTHPSEIFTTLNHIAFLATQRLLPSLPSATMRSPPETTLLESLAPVARILRVFGTPDIRDCTLVGIRRVAAWGCISPLVPFVFGALLDDVATCSWALGVERWMWDGCDGERESYPEDGADTEACPLPGARRSTGGFSRYEAREGAAGHSTLELAALLFAIDRMIPPAYREALGRACAQADLTSKDKTMQLVDRFEYLLAVVKGESGKDHADARVRGSHEGDGRPSRRGRIPVLSLTREIPT